MISEAEFNDVVNITVQNGTVLTGRLTVPVNSKAIIIFSHGGGSSHLSPRNQYVAEILQKEKFATLLVDLLTPEENKDDVLRADINNLAQRLINITDWIDQNPYTEALYVGLVGTSSGAAAALQAVAKTQDKIDSLVARGGRLQLVETMLVDVNIPVLLLVGSMDTEAVQENKEALVHLPDGSDLKIIEGASHDFEEPGKLEEVGEIARDWFLKTI